MATFAEEYKALDTVPGQKAKQYQFLSDNRSSLQLTPDEEYRFNWGPEAVSEDWISGKAKQIQSEIENANSTAILRRGLGKGEEAKSADQETKEEAKSAGEIDPLTGKPRVESNHGNDGNTNQGSPGGPGSDNTDGGAYSDSFGAGMEGVAGAVIGGLFGGVPGAKAGYSAGIALGDKRQAGWADSEAVTVSETAKRDAAKALAAERAAEQAGFNTDQAGSYGGMGNSLGSQGGVSDGSDGRSEGQGVGGRDPG